MRLTFGSYWPLALLPLIPLLWLVQGATTVDMSSGHLRLSGAVRSGVMFLTVLALTNPVLYRTGVSISVSYLLDVSESAAPEAIQSAIGWIRRADQAGHPSHSRFIPFAANSVILDSLAQLESVQVSSVAAAGTIDRSATDIEGALIRALRSFAPGDLKRLVLITDGNENSGHAFNMLPRLKQNGVRLYALPENNRADGDVWVEKVIIPPRVIAEQLFPLEVHVFSQKDTSSQVGVTQAGKILGMRQVLLHPGLNRIAFEPRITGETGPVSIEASVKAAGDPFAANDIYRESTIVMGMPKILYIEGHPESSQYLLKALRSEGFQVELASATSLPDNSSGLDTYDAVILSDVPRVDLSEKQMEAIAAYVRDIGGGLVLAGGENNYGQGGYSKTPIEEILPVRFDTQKEKPKSLALAVVLDKSGSMAGQKIELAKEATKATLRLLKDSDLFGVVAFDFNSYWIVHMQQAANREMITRAISSIAPGGDTNIYPALNETYTALQQAAAQVKHVILLSDGYSVPNDYQELVLAMAAARITVSTVAVGSGADRDLLTNIASWGGGRTYYIKDATGVPEIFTEETRLAAGKALREEPFNPRRRKDVEALRGIDLDAAPPLLGYVATRPKRTAEIILDYTPAGQEESDPILSRWQCGLGKTVVFASDLKDRWAAGWLRWKGYSKFWSQLLRTTIRQRDYGLFDFRAERKGKAAKLTITAMEGNGEFRNLLQPTVRVVSPDQSMSAMDLPQVGPGEYEAMCPLPQRGAYLFSAGDPITGAMSLVLPYSYPDEYHFYPPNTAILRALSEGTGGRFAPDAQSIFEPDGETTVLPTPLWPWLAASALILYLTDVLLRRIRLS